MNEFRKRLDDIYPSPFFGFIIVTILAIIGFIVTIDQEIFFSVWMFVVIFVWLFSLYSTLRVYFIRKKIFDLTYISKKQLVQYLEKRMKKEKYNFNIFRDNKYRVQLIKDFKLDIEKDKFKE